VFIFPPILDFRTPFPLMCFTETLVLMHVSKETNQFSCSLGVTSTTLALLAPIVSIV